MCYSPWEYLSDFALDTSFRIYNLKKFIVIFLYANMKKKMCLVSRKNVGLELICPYPYFSARLKRKLALPSFSVLEEGKECCCFRKHCVFR